MPLDLSVMLPEPFPHPVMMRSDLYPRRQPSREEKWGICPGSVCGALRVLVRRCREEAERRKLAMSILSVIKDCLHALTALATRARNAITQTLSSTSQPTEGAPPAISSVSSGIYIRRYGLLEREQSGKKQTARTHCAQAVCFRALFSEARQVTGSA